MMHYKTVERQGEELVNGDLYYVACGPVSFSSTLNGTMTVDGVLTEVRFSNGVAIRTTDSRRPKFFETILNEPQEQE